jgi:hypothetical protein
MSHGRSLTNGYVSGQHGRCGGAAGEGGSGGRTRNGAARKSRARRDMSCGCGSWGVRGWGTAHGARNNGVMRTRSAEEELNNSENWSSVKEAVRHSERSSLVD